MDWCWRCGQVFNGESYAGTLAGHEGFCKVPGAPPASIPCKQCAVTFEWRFAHGKRKQAHHAREFRHQRETICRGTPELTYSLAHTTCPHSLSGPDIGRCHLPSATMFPKAQLCLRENAAFVNAVSQSAIKLRIRPDAEDPLRPTKPAVSALRSCKPLMLASNIKPCSAEVSLLTLHVTTARTLSLPSAAVLHTRKAARNNPARSLPPCLLVPLFVPPSCC